MGFPSFLTILKLECFSTEDLILGDDLVGVIGADRFSLGHFAERTVLEQFVRPIVFGESTFEIYEQDFFDPNDLLLSVNLLEQMDTERLLTIQQGTARYDVRLMVTSQPG